MITIESNSAIRVLFYYLGYFKKIIKFSLYPLNIRKLWALDWYIVSHLFSVWNISSIFSTISHPIANYSERTMLMKTF